MENTSIEQFVKTLFDSHPYQMELLTLITAQNDLDEFRRSGFDMPGDITAEEYMKTWNSLVENHRKDVAKTLYESGWRASDEEDTAYMAKENNLSREEAAFIAEELSKIDAAKREENAQDLRWWMVMDDKGGYEWDATDLDCAPDDDIQSVSLEALDRFQRHLTKSEQKKYSELSITLAPREWPDDAEKPINCPDLEKSVDGLDLKHSNLYTGRKIKTPETNFEVFEDNAGGLQLVVRFGSRPLAIFDGFGQEPLSPAISDLKDDPTSWKTWDGNIVNRLNDDRKPDDPEWTAGKLYEEVTKNGVLVAWGTPEEVETDEKAMGFAARRALGCFLESNQQDRRPGFLETLSPATPADGSMAAGQRPRKAGIEP